MRRVFFYGGLASASDVSCRPHQPLNLAAIAAFHAGLSIDPGEVSLDVVVVKSRPAMTPTIDTI